jgi:hypothetical protein
MKVKINGRVLSKLRIWCAGRMFAASWLRRRASSPRAKMTADEAVVLIGKLYGVERHLQ